MLKPRLKNKNRFFAETFKLQRPLFSDPQPEILVYNQKRTKQFTVPATEENLKVFGDEDKIYVKGFLRPSDKQLEVLRVIGDQPW